MKQMQITRMTMTNQMKMMISMIFLLAFLIVAVNGSTRLITSTQLQILRCNATADEGGAGGGELSILEATPAELDCANACSHHTSCMFFNYDKGNVFHIAGGVVLFSDNHHIPLILQEHYKCTYIIVFICYRNVLVVCVCVCVCVCVMVCMCEGVCVK